MTAAETILLAAADLPSPFSAEALVVAAWQASPQTFGLLGYADAYPNANTVLAALMGTRGLVARGYLDRPAPRQYRLTIEGRRVVGRLTGAVEEPPAVAEKPKRPAKVTAADGLFRRLLAADAVRRFRDLKQRGELTFADACRFWGLSGQPTGEQVDVRLAATDSAVAELGRLTAAGDIVLSDGRCVTAEDAGRLSEVDVFLRRQFSRHLKLMGTRRVSA